MKPDYRNSIVNLISSIAYSFGYNLKYPKIKGLTIKPSKNIILVVLDAFGYSILKNYAKGTLFEKYLVKKITSVFPSTTAAAIPSFATGVAPQQHGFISWNSNVIEFGGLSQLLPFRFSLGGPSFGNLGVNPLKFFKHKSLTDIFNFKSYIVVPIDMVGTESYYMFSNGARAFGYEDLGGFIKGIILSSSYTNRRKFIYAYWPLIDSIGHEFGVGSKEMKKHIRQLHTAFEKLFSNIKDSTVIITADHGMINTKKRINLNNIPGFIDTLALPMTGEPRAGLFFVRPGKVALFKELWRKHLSRHSRLVKTAKLIKESYFGLYNPSKEFLRRVGDYAILPDDEVAINTFLANEKENWFIGNHGGLSKDEMEVPLIIK